MRAVIAAGWKAGIKAVTEAPPGMASYVAFPWLVDNSRLKRETGFEYQHTTGQAFEAFAQSLSR
jgi:hypothetical protein